MIDPLLDDLGGWRRLHEPGPASGVSFGHRSGEIGSITVTQLFDRVEPGASKSSLFCRLTPFTRTRSAMLTHVRIRHSLIPVSAASF